MCGIVGEVSFLDCQVQTFESMAKVLDSISHRGPDDSGILVDKCVALGHVRLSILDLSSLGKQPMKSQCGRYVIVYNGEIYNFKQLAAQYNIKCKSSSDTEVILELFSVLGEALFSQLNGMFAFCIYDTFYRKCWIVRDRFGIKPLYYSNNQNRFIFSSEIKALHLMNSSLQKNIEVEKLGEWAYFGNSLGEVTLVSKVSQLMPGCFVKIDIDSKSIVFEQYFSFFNNEVPEKENKKSIFVPEDLHSKNIRELLEQAVTRQLVSDVPLGVFLSGGIDSSVITAFASRNSNSKLKTYSVEFDFQKEQSELIRARKVASLFNTEHHEVKVSGDSVVDVFEKMVHHFDLPFGDAANIPLYILCSRVSSDIKVALQGDGGDEIFGGYSRYNWFNKYYLIRFIVSLFGPLNSFTTNSIAKQRRQRFIDAFNAKSVSECIAMLLTVEQTSRSPLNIFSESIKQRASQFDSFVRYKNVAKLSNSRAPIDQLFLSDISIILHDIFLPKVDRSTMAASVEVRVPFLDNDLVDYCLSIPGSVKVKNGVQKYLLKKSMEGIVPNDILYGRKQGFGVPYEYWIKTSLNAYLRDNLSVFYKNNPKILDQKYVSELIIQHANGTIDNGFLLWKLLNFVVWINKSGYMLNDY